MIPAFEENGYLPPGVHSTTLDEIEERFGLESEVREAQMQSLRWLVDLIRRAGLHRLVINGSFVTDAYEPNDVDCVVLLPEGVELSPELEAEFSEGLPFLQIELAAEPAFSMFVTRFYATDRNLTPKGVGEVVL